MSIYFKSVTEYETELMLMTTLKFSLYHNKYLAEVDGLIWPVKLYIKVEYKLLRSKSLCKMPETGIGRVGTV